MERKKDPHFVSVRLYLSVAAESVLYNLSRFNTAVTSMYVARVKVRIRYFFYNASYLRINPLHATINTAVKTNLAMLSISKQ